MKKYTILLALCVAIFLLTACDGLNSRDAVVDMFRRNEERFLAAADQRDFVALEHLPGVQEVRVYKDRVEFDCGGAGFGSSTHYYGIFFSEADDLMAAGISCGSADRLRPDGAGYRYRQNGGDNEYYVEPLGNHYFYYEAHY